MIPSDVASRLQLPTDAAVARAPTAQQVSSALADLSPGQRVLAEIQTLLPTGAYRALINQRDITLALPFSAKAGDTLELEVVESEGRLALAVIARKDAADATPRGERPAVETTLSRTGNFIAGLLGRGEDGDTAKPAPLNANQPIAATPPAKGSDLVPLLKQALSQSGMFYESHQAQWVSSRLPMDVLLAEPQGRLSTLRSDSQGDTARGAPVAASIVAPTLGKVGADGAEVPVAGMGDTTRPAAPALPPGQLVALDLVPLVQQQLEALANQTFAWQGQVWPGQQMKWEIAEDGHRNAEGEPDASTQWQTRLTLSMPELGEVRAVLRLREGDISLMLSTDDNDAASRLSGGGEALRTQFESAGLTLSGLSIGRHERTEG
ncbi:MAG: flagellar hook-length control protein FliK [Rhodocyclaceae bacterium]|nr:flagellar hook-length control protein FliK [Rhodocyclaceae bacterium]